MHFKKENLDDMKKLIFALTAAVTMVAGAAQAERYVMVTHGEGKDPFWPVVQKGGEDAARAVGADFEYIFNPSGDMVIWPNQSQLPRPHSGRHCGVST